MEVRVPSDSSQDGKEWKAEFERLAREKQEATLQRDDLQRRLNDAE